MGRATVRTSIGKSSPFRSWDCGGIIRSVSACSCGPRSRAERCPGSTVLRKEGGTMYLQQSHADAGVGLAYLLGRNGQVELGYHFTYFLPVRGQSRGQKPLRADRQRRTSALHPPLLAWKWALVVSSAGGY